MSTPLGPAGWHPDPTGRYEYRYFNGHQWTADVSLHGQRFIDNGGPPVWQAGWGPDAPSTNRRTRGLAMASFVVGLVSLGLAWIPFVFVLGAAGAITAFVLGIVGLRHSSRIEGYGQGYAVFGVILSVVAALVCVGGFFFTRVVLRETNAYLDPGPHTTAITKCVMEPQTGLRMEGSIHNDDTEPHRYEVTAEYQFESGSSRSEVIHVPSVPPGSSANLSSAITVVRSGTVHCAITSVNGPLPFSAANG